MPCTVMEESPTVRLAKLQRLRFTSISLPNCLKNPHTSAWAAKPLPLLPPPPPQHGGSPVTCRNPTWFRDVQILSHPLNTPLHRGTHLMLPNWVQVVVVPEQLESPISPLPDRPRGEAHSQEAHTRQQQWKCRRRRSNSCHQQGRHLPPQGSHLPGPLTGHVCPLGHLTTPTHHLSKLKSNTGNHLSSHQITRPIFKTSTAAWKGMCWLQLRAK